MCMVDKNFLDYLSIPGSFDDVNQNGRADRDRAEAEAIESTPSVEYL